MVRSFGDTTIFNNSSEITCKLVRCNPATILKTYLVILKIALGFSV
jgi:uncharacterized ParB-like nuclease family protein